MSSASTTVLGYMIRVRLADMSRAQLLAPNGCLVTRRVHAAALRDIDRAEHIAASIRAEHPGAVVTVITV